MDWKKFGTDTRLKAQQAAWLKMAAVVRRKLYEHLDASLKSEKPGVNEYWACIIVKDMQLHKAHRSSITDDILFIKVVFLIGKYHDFLRLARLSMERTTQQY